MVTGQQLHDQYITALIFLRKCHMNYGEPINLNYLLDRVNRLVVKRLLEEGMVNYYPNYFWAGDTKSWEVGVEISWAGLYRIWKEVKPLDK
jgi:hypothetical protein